LLKLKAEAELERLEKSPPSQAVETINEPKADDDSPEAGPDRPKPVDPEQLKAGFQKAIELAPQAVEQMDSAVKALKQKDRQTAYPPAEEARKILEEIQKAQPRQQPPEQKQDQEKKNEDQQQQDQKKDEQQKKDDEKKDEEDKDKGQQKPEDQNKHGEKKQDQKQPQISQDKIEEALRKVRERQQEKRERDRKMKARVSGRIPVEKDW
jgi:hypothetical protein